LLLWLLLLLLWTANACVVNVTDYVTQRCEINLEQLLTQLVKLSVNRSTKRHFCVPTFADKNVAEFSGLHIIISKILKYTVSEERLINFN